MIGGNIKYYRLKNDLTKKALAEKVGVTPMAITYYENDSRRPSMEILKRLAAALNVRVSDFIGSNSSDLQFVHGEFRKNSKLNTSQQDLIRSSVENYFSRFYSAANLLGGEVLPAAPVCLSLNYTGDIEYDAKSLREYLQLPLSGPVGNLTAALENQGILVYMLNMDSGDFSGMNGTVNNRPYIVVNRNMSPERIRSTMIHEVSHFAFDWPDTLSEKDIENYATAVSGAVLFPAEDARRELGLRRVAVTNDMLLTCKEYGISMMLLVKRSNLLGILSDGVSRDFYMRASKAGWRRNEPHRIPYEDSHLFKQLVFRAVAEDEISVSKGAELLNMPYDTVMQECRSFEVQ